MLLAVWVGAVLTAHIIIQCLAAFIRFVKETEIGRQVRDGAPFELLGSLGIPKMG